VSIGKPPPAAGAPDTLIYVYIYMLVASACMACHEKIGPPLFLFPPVQKYRNIWTPGTKMFEIIGPPLKYFIPLQNLPKHYFHASIKGVQIFHLK